MRSWVRGFCPLLLLPFLAACSSGFDFLGLFGSDRESGGVLYVDYAAASVSAGGDSSGSADLSSDSSCTGYCAQGFSQEVSLKKMVHSLSHSCAIDTEGELYCWGRNLANELGRQKASPGIEPMDRVLVLDGVFQAQEKVVDVATGGNHLIGFTCALSDLKRLVCWGADFQGTEYTIDYNLAELGFNALQVTAGETHACALIEEESGDHSNYVFCWGLLNGLIEIPEEPIQIASGRNHVCALAESGRVYCAGTNEKGQLGNGNLVSSYQTATKVILIQDFKSLDLEAIVKVAAGGNHTCAIDQDGKAFCWGANDSGQLGFSLLGKTWFALSVPLEDGISAKDVAAGDRHSLLITNSNQVLGSGNNELGQLGSLKEAKSAKFTEIQL